MACGSFPLHLHAHRQSRCISAGRIGKGGIELFFQESIRVNNKKDDDRHHDTAFIDSTVQEKFVTYPTDAKLHKKTVRQAPGIVRRQGLPLRQSYRFVLKRICRDQRSRNHPENRNKALRADRKLRTMVGTAGQGA